MYNCVSDCLCFFFDKAWWKDYGIPLLGAVAIPLLVWFLTWYYGAEKAEGRKEKRDLRDNLNLLLTICLDAIIQITHLRATLIKICELERKGTSSFSPIELEPVLFSYSYPNDFKFIDVAKYSPCIVKSENYVLHLLLVKNTMDLCEKKIESRNKLIEKFVENKDLTYINMYLDNEIKENEAFIKTVENFLLVLRDFISETKDLENKIDGLKLDTIRYYEEQQQLFAELEQKYAKEQEK